MDPLTGYSYYSIEQLPRLNSLVALKELGFSLEQISRLIEEDVDARSTRLASCAAVRSRLPQAPAPCLFPGQQDRFVRALRKVLVHRRPRLALILGG